MQLLKLITVLCLIASVSLSGAVYGASSSYYTLRTSAAAENGYEGKPCRVGSPYYEARRIGKNAFTERNTLDLQELLSESPPLLHGVYGKCTEALNSIKSIMDLFSPSIFISIASLDQIIERLKQKVIEGVCSEVEEFAYEIYEDISDAIPIAEYAYHLEDLFEIEVTL